MEKGKLRKEIKKLLCNVKNKDEKTKKIHERLFTLKEWESARVVAVTISIKNEIDTYKVISRGWKEGKIICAPKCNPHTKEMEFRVITSFSQVEETFFNLIEPIESKTTLLATVPDLVIVPGLAFTRNGSRLGYGGGYYDRYLQQYMGATVSIAYEEQIVELINTELHDCSVQKIVTDEEVYE